MRATTTRRSLPEIFSLNARLFFEGALLSFIALFHWLRPATYLASKIVMPLASLLFFALLGSFGRGAEYLPFFAIGNALQMAAVNGIYGVTLSIGGDRWAGTLAYLFGTPANRLALFLGRAFFHVIDGMIGVGFGLLWGVLLLGLDLSHANPLALVLTIFLATFSTSGLGLLLGCLSLTVVDVMFINNMIYFVLLFLSGANVPLAELPAFIQPISWALPLTRGIMAARALVDGQSLASVAPLLAGEFAIGVAYVVAGYVFFQWFERQAKRRGTLEVF